MTHLQILYLLPLGCAGLMFPTTESPLKAPGSLPLPVYPTHQNFPALVQSTESTELFHPFIVSPPF